MIRSESILVFAFVTLGAALSGCIPFGDPEGPGASGSISMGKEVSQSGVKSLHVRAIPDAGKPFDPAAPQFTAPAPAEETAWLAVDENLTGVTFPHPYTIGAVLGTTSQQHWRLFAWLSAEDISAAPKSGEPFGTTPFDVASCGFGYGGYCGVLEGVDITIDQKAP